MPTATPVPPKTQGEIRLRRGWSGKRQWSQPLVVKKLYYKFHKTIWLWECIQIQVRGPWNLSFISFTVNLLLNFLPLKFSPTRAAVVSLGRMCICSLNLMTRSIENTKQTRRRHVHDCFPAGQFITFNRTIPWHYVDQWLLNLAVGWNCLHYIALT